MFENLNVMAFDWRCLCPVLPFLMFALHGPNSLILEYRTNNIQRLNQYTELRLASTCYKADSTAPRMSLGGRQTDGCVIRGQTSVSRARVFSK